jgi:hypothetical protein
MRGWWLATVLLFACASRRNETRSAPSPEAHDTGPEASDSAAIDVRDGDGLDAPIDDTVTDGAPDTDVPDATIPDWVRTWFETAPVTPPRFAAYRQPFGAYCSSAESPRLAASVGTAGHAAPSAATDTARAPVFVGPVEFVSPGLTREIVVRVVRWNREAFAHCVTSPAARAPLLTRLVAVDVLIAPQGTAARATATDGEGHATSVSECVAETVQRVAFPITESSAWVHFRAVVGICAAPPP